MKTIVRVFFAVALLYVAAPVAILAQQSPVPDVPPIFDGARVFWAYFVVGGSDRVDSQGRTLDGYEFTFAEKNKCDLYSRVRAYWWDAKGERFPVRSPQLDPTEGSLGVMSRLPSIVFWIPEDYVYEVTFFLPGALRTGLVRFEIEPDLNAENSTGQGVCVEVALLIREKRDGKVIQEAKITPMTPIVEARFSAVSLRPENEVPSDTGVALGNPNAVPLDVEITLRDLNIKTTVTIPPMGQVAKFIREIFAIGSSGEFTDTAIVRVVKKKDQENPLGITVVPMLVRGESFKAVPLDPPEQK